MTQDDFDIIALNGITGDCLTTADAIDADFSESTSDANLEAIRQEHEPFLTRLEALAVCAIALRDWSKVYDFINFHAPESQP